MGKIEEDVIGYYKEKNKEYFSGIRWDIINLIPPLKNAKVLEIGAGEGNTLIKLKELGLANEIVGVDIIQLTDSNQTHPLMDKFIIGDIEKINLEFPSEYFDIIICADILEHLYDPWKTVNKLAFYLKKYGFFISSLPNIIIVEKDFKYEETGILDKTHLRFFCKRNIINLFIGLINLLLNYLKTF